VQFLVVNAKKRKTGDFINDIPVLIDGVENGATGSLIKMDGGTVDLSVSANGAEETTVDVEDTTQTNPLQVNILID